MSGYLIQISSLKPIEIEFEDALQKEKYACFLPKIEILGSKIRLLAIPYNRGVRWFLAQEIDKDEEVATLRIIDSNTLQKEMPTDKVITLPLRENGSLDNTKYQFYGDVDRHSKELKMIEVIRKNSIAEYSFYQSPKGTFTITPRRPEFKF